MRTKLAVAAMLVTMTGFAQNRSNQPTVRAKEPTVVTVEGRPDRVKEDTQNADTQKPRKGFASRLGGGIKTAATATWNGMVGFVGWLPNTRETVPSDRSRKREEDR